MQCVTYGYIIKQTLCAKGVVGEIIFVLKNILHKPPCSHFSSLRLESTLLKEAVMKIKKMEETLLDYLYVGMFEIGVLVLALIRFA